jgi:hypothetical protein
VLESGLIHPIVSWLGQLSVTFILYPVGSECGAALILDIDIAVNDLYELWNLEWVDDELVATSR